MTGLVVSNDVEAGRDHTPSRSPLARPPRRGRIARRDLGRAQRHQMAALVGTQVVTLRTRRVWKQPQWRAPKDTGSSFRRTYSPEAVKCNEQAHRVLG